jgi:DNA modification methylase
VSDKIDYQVFFIECPGCGKRNFDGPHYNGPHYNNEPESWWIECKTDGCQWGMETEGDDVNKLIEKWNTRAGNKPIINDDRRFAAIPDDVKVIDQVINNKSALYHGDCVEIIKAFPDNSIGYSMFSPPFADLFTYSDSKNDMGNCRGTDDFKQHFYYLVEQLYRVIMEGRLVSIHCMDLPATLGRDGYIGQKDFPGEMIRIFERAGFIYHSRVTIWKDPLIQAVRTKQLSLAHKQISKDSSRCGMGYPDYIVTMRKPGDNKKPISHGRGFEEYIGERPEPNEQKNDNPQKNKYSHMVWQRYASPVWDDIRQTETLNCFRAAKGENDEKHICPLQIDTVKRCLELWSVIDDVVLDPFMGIGTVPLFAIKSGRKAVGIELKETYFKMAVSKINESNTKHTQISIFDLLKQ